MRTSPPARPRAGPPATGQRTLPIVSHAAGTPRHLVPAQVAAGIAQVPIRAVLDAVAEGRVRSERIGGKMFVALEDVEALASAAEAIR